eukprot:172628_1
MGKIHYLPRLLLLALALVQVHCSIVIYDEDGFLCDTLFGGYVGTCTNYGDHTIFKGFYHGDNNRMGLMEFIKCIKDPYWNAICGKHIRHTALGETQFEATYPIAFWNACRDKNLLEILDKSVSLPKKNLFKLIIHKSAGRAEDVYAGLDMFHK